MVQREVFYCLYTTEDALIGKKKTDFVKNLEIIIDSAVDIAYNEVVKNRTCSRKCSKNILETWIVLKFLNV